MSDKRMSNKRMSYKRRSNKRMKNTNEKRERQFIDTNILVYAYDITAGEKHEQAKRLIIDLWNSRKGCLSIQVFQEFYVTIVKKVASPIKPEDVYRIISDLGLWSTHVPTVEDVLEAIDIQQRNNLSFWDSLIVCSANRMRCDVIYSEDLNNGQVYEGVKVINPFTIN